MEFSVLFWNIWLDNQLGGEQAASKLLKELARIITIYKPDCIGLCEVLRLRAKNRAFVLEFLKTHGYNHVAYAPAAPLDDNWLVGTALCSRHKLSSVQTPIISTDTPAARRGFPNHQLTMITARVLRPGGSVRVMVAHPMHLRSYTLKEHYAGTSRILDIVGPPNHREPLVLGGDFNEPGFMPKAFRKKVEDVLHRRTGNILRPTWRHNGWHFTPIRANLDHLYWSKQSLLQLKEFVVIDSSVSDHRPLFAKFGLGADG